MHMKLSHAWVHMTVADIGWIVLPYLIILWWFGWMLLNVMLSGIQLYSDKTQTCQYAISQLRIIHSGLHLVTYLDVGNFCDKSTETTLYMLYEICVQVFLRFSDSSKPIHIINLRIGLAWLAGICKSEENLFKTSCNVVPITKVAHIFWWRHNRKKIGKCAWTLMWR